MTIKDLAQYVGVSDTMIRGIDRNYLNRKSGKPRRRHLEIIAIDEIHVGKKNPILHDWGAIRPMRPKMLKIAGFVKGIGWLRAGKLITCI